MVHHVNNITIYKNLETVVVEDGQEVEVGESLGKKFTNKVTNKTIIVLAIFKETKIINSNGWLLRM